MLTLVCYLLQIRPATIAEKVVQRENHLHLLAAGKMETPPCPDFFYYLEFPELLDKVAELETAYAEELLLHATSQVGMADALPPTRGDTNRGGRPRRDPKRAGVEQQNFYNKKSVSCLAVCFNHKYRGRCSSRIFETLGGVF